MPQQLQTGQTTVTGNVTTTIAAQAGVALQTKAVATQNGAGTATIHTVTAGKTARVYGATMEVRFGAGANTAYVACNGTPILVAGTQTSGSVAPVVCFGNNYIEVAATQTITLTLSGGGNGTATIWYVEV